MKRYFIIVFLVFAHLLKAQLGKEAWHWQFGQHVSLDFSIGTPLTGTCALSVMEGCASCSDPNTGALLFYSDGTTVWDKNNHQMPNGFGLIGGYGTSTQAALIVPQPGSSTLYYLISSDQGGYISPNQGVHYSVIDMSLNGGLGDVTIKNALLTPPPATEKLTAIRHCNGKDYWVITHLFKSKSFNVYSLTSAGLDTVPVVSSVGTIHNGFEESNIGYLKASPNGKKLACAVFGSNFVELFDFNKSTGQVSNPVKIQNNNIVQPYGVAFSPDNTKLYVTAGWNIFQFDITSNNAASILTSATDISSVLYNHSLAGTGAVQLAPDGKIYMSLLDFDTLGVISNPNSAGLSCNFTVNGPVIPSGSGNLQLMGLPNFIDHNVSVNLMSPSNIQLCTFVNHTLTANSGNNYQWSNADTNQTTSIQNFGTYWVSYVNAEGCIEVDTFHVTKTNPPTINILHDTSQCGNLKHPIAINATDSNAVSYLWSDGFTMPEHTMTIPGSYWVEYSFPDYCVSIDSFNYYIDSIPSVNLGNDTILCKPYTLSAHSNEEYVWSTGDTTQQITINTSGSYSLTVTSPQGCINADTVNVTINTPPIIQVLKDTFECGTAFNSYTVNAYYPNTLNYSWSDGFTGQSHTIDQPGIYWVDYSLNNTCTARDSFAVNLYNYPSVYLGADTTFCLGNLSLNAYCSNCTYLWSTGQTSSQIIATKANIYWVQVSYYGCLNSDTLIVHPDYSKLKFEMSNIVTPNNDGINDEIDFSKYQFDELQLNIYNRWGNQVFESSDLNCIWKPTQEDGTYFYTLQYKADCGSESKQQTLKGFITIVR